MAIKAKSHIQRRIAAKQKWAKLRFRWDGKNFYLKVKGQKGTVCYPNATIHRIEFEWSDCVGLE